MKLSRYLFFAVLALTSLVFFSCSSSDKKKHKVNIAEIQAVNHEDTLRSLNMTRDFMEKLKQNKVEEAVNMLVEYNPAHDSLSQISTKKKQEYASQFKMMPVREYEVQTSKFMNKQMSIVTYRYRFMDNPTNDANYPCSTSITLAVRKIKGKYQMYLYNH